MIPIEKAKYLFLKYYRICGDSQQSKQSSIGFCNKFIGVGEDVEYWGEVINEINEIKG